jgi:GNAT superfamily N-acetyltransferase
MEFSIRVATHDDVAAMICLLLTSFRRFPLFDYLYSPLKEDCARAYDTIYFWTRRMRLALLDPSTMVVVAETFHIEDVAFIPDDTLNARNRESQNILDWLGKNTTLSQNIVRSGSTVVGFAIWRWEGIALLPRLGLFNSLQSKSSLSLPVVEILRSWTDSFIKLELWLATILFTRKDQDRARYAAYLRSEVELEEKSVSEKLYKICKVTKVVRFHRGSFLYLDNLCTDFRQERRGIGRALVLWGIEKAQSKNLPIRTETDFDIMRLYSRLGFRELGYWYVHTPEPTERIKLVVLEWEPPII